MKIDRGPLSPWRRLRRWVKTGDGSARPDREVVTPPVARNDNFLADLDEAQTRAVLGAITRSRNPDAPD